MRQLTEDVYWLTSSIGANCYWVDLGSDRVAIIDPGRLWGVNRVARELRKAGRSPYEVTDILLTHGDVDHAQAAAEWQRRTGARVYLGAHDVAVLAGEREPKSRRRKLTRHIATAQIPDNLETLDGNRPLAGELTAIKSDGHTPGHHAFRYRDVLFAGDAGRCVGGRLVAMPAYLDDNPGRSAAALSRLQALDVAWYCCGHSTPARAA